MHMYISIFIIPNMERVTMWLFIVPLNFRLSEVCSHIGALLFKIEASVRLGYTKKTHPERPCQWNAEFIDEVNPAPVKDILFDKNSCVKKAKKGKVKTQFTKSTEEQHTLLQKPLCMSIKASSPKYIQTIRRQILSELNILLYKVCCVA